MRFSSRIILVLLSLVLIDCGNNVSQHQKMRFEEGVEQIRKDLRNAGLAVVLVKDKKIAYSATFGVKNLVSNEPLHEDDMFRIASISKSFTTTALLQLVEQGKVDLQTDVSMLAGYVIRNPLYPSTPITLEMLLSHTSSLNDSEGYYNLDLIADTLNPNRKKCFNAYEPGHGYEYCNLNLNLAGSFLEKISCERFDQYIQNHILTPLQIEGGYCVDSLDRSKFVSLYDLSEGEPRCTDLEAYAPRSDGIATYRFGYDTPLFSPTGGMKMSALSLARYMIMHMNGGVSDSGYRIISDESEMEMRRERSEQEHYGLTLWQTSEYSDGEVLIGHTGGAYGMRSAMFFNPEKKYGFVVISSGALEHTPQSDRDADPSGSAADEGNILTRTLKLMYECFIK
ncbi:MAG: beta-lactamase family protein [Paludibacteraceae bacterium]|nr:beta-lactamase family protein [Paludibacteraceae bacterium]